MSEASPRSRLRECIDAAQAQADERRGAADRRRIASLEATVRDLYLEARERDRLLLSGGPVGGGAASPAVRELQSLFRDIAARTVDVASLVTVIIPVYGKIEYTLRCLRSIAVGWSDAVSPTIVVVDDASPDGSARQLLDIPLVTVLQNGRNLGYLRSSNRGALLATTKYVCFLNNDTEVRPGWLDWLVRTAEEDPRVGVVGSKLVYPDGTLQDAGSIIWNDASGWNVGRGGDPEAPEYNIRRDADFVCGASLLIRTDLLRQIGGYDDRYAPAYYEDADLCFAARARGYRVVYEPGSEVVHHEGVSSGTDLTSGVKRYQVVNQPKFAEKWKDVLPAHLPPAAANVPAAVARSYGRPAILIIDSYIPRHDREAGSNRLFKIIRILRDAGYYVVFLPDNYAGGDSYAADLARLGVETIYGRTRGADRDDILRAILPRIDVAWICRPELCSHYLPVVRAAGSVPVIYDTIDLHFMRERARAEIEETSAERWQTLQRLELETARAADLVITVTEAEKTVLNGFGIDGVAVVPTIHDAEMHAGLGYAARSGVIFIGGYGHTPNVDAAQWLAEEIMPRVWERLPGVRLTLLGSDPPAGVERLRSDLIDVTGFVADVGPYFERARVFAAALRYGAGMKGKVGQALSYGLPVVTTKVGVDGYDLRDGRDCFIADDADGFAEAIVQLYADEVTWKRFSAEGQGALRNLGSEAVAARITGIVGTFLAPR